MTKQTKNICLSVALLVCQIAPFPARSASLRQAVTQSPASVRVKGLRERVTVRRDGRGIPYVEAANEEDLFFMQGYVTAVDRLWQMDLLRRTARGELAEIFGPDVLKEDQNHRLYGLAKLSGAMFAQASPRVRSSLEAYARGVNAFISTRDAKTLPVEFQLLQYTPRAWTPADSLVIGKLLAESLSTTWQLDLMRLSLADLPEEKRDVLLPVTSPLDVLLVGSDQGRRKATAHVDQRAAPHVTTEEASAAISVLSETARHSKRSLERIGLYAEGLAASNNWVVSGKHTATGKPLLANDPHLSSSAPSIWYMVHLSVPGWQAAGVTLPGAPGVIIGHNAQIAWGITNLGADAQDLYAETFDPNDARRYKTGGGWREASIRREEIKVRPNPAAPATETVNFEVTETQHGPIVFETKGTRYALRWTALDPQATELSAFLDIARARDWKEFRSALQTYSGPAQNFVYADVKGHIGYQAAGRIPLRKTGDGSLPYNGATGEGLWSGMLPLDALPRLYDPQAGIIVTANNRVVGSNYPYHLTHSWAEPYRARRISELLRGRQKLTADDFRSIQGDTYSIGAATFAREVAKLAAERPSDAGGVAWSPTVGMFAGWDGYMNADSRVAPFVVAMRAAFRRRLIVNALGAERAQRYIWDNVDTFVDRMITERPHGWLPPEFKDYVELLRACEADARAALLKRLGADESQWKWGNYARVRFPHPLDSVPGIGKQFLIPPFPQNGSGVNNGSTVNVGAGVSMRLITDTSNWDKTLQTIAPGESGDPSDSHWADQLEDWRSVRSRVFPFTKSSILSVAETTSVFEPARESASGKTKE